MRDTAPFEFRRLYTRIERAERRIAMTTLSGKVAVVDPEQRLLRLKLGTSSDGRDVLSPWVRWQEAGAGGLKIHSEPAVNEQMNIISSSGTVGAGSIAVPATYDRDHQAPSQSSDTAVFERGTGRIEVGPNGLKFIGDTIELVGNVRARDGVFEHEDVDVGVNHKHTKVVRGEQLTGPPEE
ncbi:Phage baseplate assembly protein V [Neorhizobium galegae bv. officinalis bv. officinalis str. HAMBI 1141]|uniref:Phage baseplate assembly protein V n=1 Tax=Neorhizobium galegae bv. officinalis bv. officinalis str. HAMBI 1141 TaxID=1028801 RepID=A0A068T8A3_NEOGA|nr:phage baseplate assembly protein V [Neorhizobium galegae]CDN54757.1 Phage baseplate assembly protein V [Neorhizobium galegae bv. officinalis bv. officinalis str. HAMBI 1141]